MGVPIGIFVDHRGPRPAVLVGSVILAIGYFPLHEAYDSASGPVPLLCFFSYLSGLGGCMAFAASVKTSALNWPEHRGTATAFPLAAFGLSAFFFSLIGSILFPGDPSDFLMLLAVGTCGLTFVGFFFLKVYPHAHSEYRPVPLPSSDDEETSVLPPEQRNLSASTESKVRRGAHHTEPGTSLHESPIVSPNVPRAEASTGPDDFDGGETSSLMSNASSSHNVAGTDSVVDVDRSHRVDIRGLELLRSFDFWQLFLIMGILAGIGLMTIK